MKKIIYTFICLAATSFFLTRCNKTDGFQSAPLSDYMNLAVGKYITYRLDSLKYINFGQKDTTIKYQAKDIIEGSVTDNLNRPGWRVVRYLNDTAALGNWNINMTYFIFPTRETIEVIENNNRFQKLKLPIKNDFSWKGNTYIDTYSAYTAIPYLDNWDYTYASVDQPFTPATTAVDNTVTVNQRDELLGTPGNVDAYSERNYSREVYGKGIGMVYKNFLHWVFQPRTTTYPNGYYEGYGITLRMIDHN
jgi:hypothetical protein